MNQKIVIIGGGPAGTACAIELHKLGFLPILVEKEEFPRFHIGESMTGECGASIRKLGAHFESLMSKTKYPIKYGTEVYGADGKNSFYVPVMARNEAGELVGQTTWQVRRSTFDKMLFDAVAEMGIETVKGTACGVVTDNGTIKSILVNVGEHELELSADLVVDASGQSTFLSRQGIAGEREPGKYGKQIGIFGHFKNAIRDDTTTGHKIDDTLIFYRERNHWAWFIPLDEEIVSIGVVVPADYFKEKNESREAFLLREMHLMNSALAWRVKDAELVDEVRGMSNYSYQIRSFTGRGFICIGDAHRFIDPIFSFGLHFALHEGRTAAAEIAGYFEKSGDGGENPFIEYAQYCENGMDIIQTMLDAFWDYPLAFSLYMKSKKYRDDFIDLFAGRVHSGSLAAGVEALRKFNLEGAKLQAEGQDNVQAQHAN